MESGQKPLSVVLKDPEKPLTLSMKLQCCVQVAKAIEFLHQNSEFHGNLSLAKCFVRIFV
jgi:hypothetical protein